MAVKLFLSAGHNLKDRGASYGTLYENELTIKVRDAIKKYFVNSDCHVFYPEDNLSLLDTINWINGKGADRQSLAVEIHFNFSNSTAKRGVEGYYFDDTRYNNAGNAAVISSNLARVINIPDNGAKSDLESYVGKLGFLRKITCPSVIIECLYLSNAEDRAALNVENIALGIANGIKEILSIQQAELKKKVNLLESLVAKLQELLKIKNKLGSITNMEKISQTQLSNVASLAGLIVIIASYFGYGVSQDGVAFLLAAGWSVLSTAYNWYNRYSKGDISLGGFRKS